MAQSTSKRVCSESRRTRVFFGRGMQLSLVFLYLLALVFVVVLHGLKGAVDHGQLLLRPFQFNVLLQAECPLAGVDGPGVDLAQRVDDDECAVVLLLGEQLVGPVEHQVGLLLLVVAAGSECQRCQDGGDGDESFHAVAPLEVN